MRAERTIILMRKWKRFTPSGGRGRGRRGRARVGSDAKRDLMKFRTVTTIRLPRYLHQSAYGKSERLEEKFSKPREYFISNVCLHNLLRSGTTPCVDLNVLCKYMFVFPRRSVGRASSTELLLLVCTCTAAVAPKS